MNEISNASAITADELVPWALSKYEKPLMSYAFSMLRDVEQSRDAVQDTFIKLSQQEPETIREAVKAWLFTVCRNRALDMLRKQRPMISVEPIALEAVECEVPSPAENAASRDSHGRALAVLDQLPENQREVIRLRFQNDLSYREISEITELSVGNVGFLLHTGLKHLRDLLNG